MRSISVGFRRGRRFEQFIDEENYGVGVAVVGEAGGGVVVAVGVAEGEGVRDGVRVNVGIFVGASPCKIN